MSIILSLYLSPLKYSVHCFITVNSETKELDSTLAYFLDNTSLHGYFYIGSARNLAEKLFWSLIVVVALTLAVITIRKTESS